MDNVDLSVPFDEALELMAQYTPPTQAFTNQSAGTERLAVFNKVINKSDLYEMEKSKQAIRIEKKIKDARS